MGRKVEESSLPLRFGRARHRTFMQILWAVAGFQARPEYCSSSSLMNNFVAWARSRGLGVTGGSCGLCRRFAAGGRCSLSRGLATGGSCCRRLASGGSCRRRLASGCGAGWALAALTTGVPRRRARAGGCASRSLWHAAAQGRVPVPLRRT